MMENKTLITNAVTYAKREFANNAITLQDVADHAGFSVDYFNRIFLAHTGFTVMAYVNYIRLKKAIELLRHTDKTVLDIALEVGYDSHEGFLRAFKKQYGLTPSEYRSRKKNAIFHWGELTDKSVAARFLHENPDLKPVDSDEVIDYLLAKDAKRYGYFCGAIQYMGLTIAAPDGHYERGIIGIGDQQNGEYRLELVTEDASLLIEWLKRFPDAVFYAGSRPSEIENILAPYGLEPSLERPCAFYCGKQLPCTLPDNLTIRPLTFADEPQILQWANGRKNAYINHLLTECHYHDESNLDYGIFSDGILIAVAGCGIDEVHGFRYNDCCRICFADGNASDDLYRGIYAYIVNDLLSRGVLPFDSLQHGEYARTHGGFTAEDIGFVVTNWRYVLKS